MAFPNKEYISLEKPQTRSFALEDPEGFLEQFPKGAILDEIQRAPSLFSYLQILVDEKGKGGMFVFTGSQNFLVMEKISQSLAGRISLHKLLPFSLRELPKGKLSSSSLNDLLFSGGYPRIYDKSLSPTDWLGNYTETYLERDVRNLKDVGDLSAFQNFLHLCAGRAGQLLNLTSLGNDCGVTHNTAKAWLSVLEASFLIFLLRPHHKNFSKRIKKSPKLYFFDTGLLCFLLGITKPQELTTHSMRGAIFESFVISELMKRRFNQGIHSPLFFWQDKRGREIDCLVEKGEKLIPIEIKSGQTIASDYFQNLVFWRQLAGPSSSFVVYGGSEEQRRKEGHVLPWRNFDRIPL